MFLWKRGTRRWSSKSSVTYHPVFLRGPLSSRHLPRGGYSRFFGLAKKERRMVKKPQSCKWAGRSRAGLKSTRSTRTRKEAERFHGFNLRLKTSSGRWTFHRWSGYSLIIVTFRETAALSPGEIRRGTTVAIDQRPLHVIVSI